MLPTRAWRVFIERLLRTPRGRRRLLVLEHLEDRTTPATVTWIAPGGGNWDFGANWSTGSVPGPNDTAVIDSTAAIAVIIQSGDAESVASVTTGSSDTLGFTGGSLTISSSTNLLGPLNMTGGTLTATGNNVVVGTPAAATIANGSLIAEGGANITLDGLTSYSGGFGSTLEATGANSSLTIPDLTTLTSTASGTEYLQIEALGGALVDVSGLQQIHTGQVLLESDGQGGGNHSVLNLGSLQSFAESGRTNGSYSVLQASNSGFINDPGLTTTSYVNVMDGDAGLLETDQLTGMTDGELNLESGNPQFSSLSDLDGESVVVSGGATVSFPLVQSYTGPTGYWPTLLQATAGSTLTLDALTTLTAPESNNAAIVSVEALAGGDVEMTGLTQIDTGQVALESSGSGSTLDLSALQSVANSSHYYNIDSQIEDSSGGTITDPNLTSLSFTNLSLDGAGAMATSQLASVTFSAIDVSGGSPSFSSLATITGSSVDASGGAIVDLPIVTSYSNPATVGYYVPTIEASNGSSVSLANISSFIINNASGVKIEASSGGKISLASVSQLDGGAITLTSSGSGSSIDLSKLTAFGETGAADYNSSALATLQASSGGVIDDPILTSLTYTSLTIDGTGALATSQLNSATDSTLTISGGTPTFPLLADIDGSSVNVGGGVSFSLPAVLNYSGVGASTTFQATGASTTLALPNLTSTTFGTTLGSGTTMIVDGGCTVQLGASAVSMPASGTGLTFSLPQLSAGLTIDLVSNGTFSGGTVFDVPAGDTVQVLTATFTGGVTCNVAVGATLDLTGGHYGYYGGLLTGAGGGTVRLSGGGLYIETGGVTLNFPGPMFQWTGGVVDAALGNLVNVGTLNLNGFSSEGFYDDGLLENYGTLTETNFGPLELGTDGLAPTTLINEPGGKYILNSAAGLTEASDSGSAPGQMSLDNEGLIRVLAGYGAESIFNPLGAISNTGTIEVDSGTLILSPKLGVNQVSGGSLTGGAWAALAGATLDFPTGTAVTANAGSLTLGGAGAIISGIAGLASNNGDFTVEIGATFATTGSFTNNGTLTVGGALNVAGALTLTSSSIIDEQIGGPPGSGEMGLIAATGAAALASTYNFVPIDDYAPSIGQTFTTLSFASQTGQFATFFLGTEFTETLTATSLELVDAVPTSTNLTVTSVTAPTAAAAGQAVTVNWQVTNQGSNAATGNWQDSVYLSTTSSITSSSILLGAEQFSQSAPQDAGKLAPNASYNGSLTATLPALAPGNYYVLVEADSLDQLNDSDRASGVMAASTGATAISVPALTLGAPLSGAFTSDDEDHYYQVFVPAGGSLTISLASSASTGATALDVSRGVLPTAYASQYSANVGGQPSQALTVPQVTSAATYYILARGLSGNAAASDFTLTATQTSSLSVSSISSYAGGDTGDVTIEINGANFSLNLAATLTLNSTTISSSAIDYVNAGQVYATFNLGGAATGNYILGVQQGGQSATAPSQFQVTAGNAGSFSFDLGVPEYIRPGRPESVVISYTNTGNLDMTAPLLDVQSTDSETVFSTPDDPNNYAEDAQLLAVAPSGPAGVLLPGQSGQLTLTVLTNDTSDAVTSIPIQVSPIEPGQSINWASEESALQPANVSSQTWNVIWGNLTAGLGTTTDSYNAALAQAATYLGNLGESAATVSNINNLWSFLVDQADAELPQSTLASTVDSSLPTPGDLSLSIDRTFLSSISGRSTPGMFGLGWATSWQPLLSVDGSGNATLTSISPNADSQSLDLFFPVASNGAYLDVAGEYGTLSLSEGVYTYTDVSGIQFVFLPNGKLNYEQDANGNRITLGYNAQNELTSLADANPNDPLEPPQALLLSYNSQGLVSQVSDSAGDVWAYSYDSQGHLISVTAPGNLITTYTYGGPGNNETANALVSITKPDGSVQSFTYDSRGRLSSSSTSDQETLTYSYLGQGEVALMDSAGNTTTDWFNQMGLPAQVETPLGGIYRNQYDENGNLTSSTDPAGDVYQYTDNSAGSLTSITNPLGQTTTMTVGPLGELRSLTDASGNATQYRYDSGGNLLSITYPDSTTQSFSYDPLGNLAETIEQNGDPVNYTYNAEGLVTKQTFADGTSATFTYDALGDVLTAEMFSSSGASTGATALTYNSADELTSIAYPNGQYLDFSYNGLGQRTNSVDQDGYTVNYSYTSLGQLSKLTDTSNNLIVEYTYNNLGELIDKQNGNGTYTTYAYDADGNLTQEVNYANPAGTVVNSSLNYTYNVLDEMTSMTDSLGDVTTYSYDATGQLTGITLPNGGGTIAYVYNAAGDRTAVIDNSATTSYSSNSDNEIVAAGSSSFTYDANGNLASETDASGTTTYTYNDLNQLVSMTSPGGTVTTFQYSPLGSLIGENVGGTQTNYLVDPTGLGNAVASYTGTGSLIANYNYGLGLAGTTGPGGGGYYDFDASGNTIGVTGDAGTYVNQYSYLPFGETTTLSTSLPNPFTFSGQAGVMQVGASLFSMRARIYSPVVGQFLSNDPLGLAGGDTNIRRYVMNDPLDFADPSGTGLSIVGPKQQLTMEQERSQELDRQMQQLNKDIQDLENLNKQKDINAEKEREIQSLQAKIDRLRNHKPDPNGSLKPPQKKFITKKEDHDPNALIGPAGYGTSGYILDSGVLPYTIDFENDGSAAAENVSVTEQVSSNLDWSTFQFGSFSFGPITRTVPAGLTQYQTTVPYQNADGTLLDVLVDLDFHVATGLLTATFTSIDPLSGQESAGVFDGFLYPDDAADVGEGSVQYTVAPAPSLANGAAINQQASVVFDTNAAIATNTFVNTIDGAPPTSNVTALPASTTPNFTVSWSGSDPNGPGIASYTIAVSVNGGTFTPWLANTTQTSATYNGAPGDIYSFYSVATDNLGIVQPTPGSAQASAVVVDPVASTVSVSSSVQGGSSVTVTLQARANGKNITVGGLTVAFTLGGASGGQGTFSSVTDNGDGTYTATFTGTTAGSNTIVATIDGVSVSTTPPTITVTPGPLSLSNSLLTLSQPNLQLGGVATIAFQPRDAEGNPLTTGGFTVAFALANTSGAKGVFSKVAEKTPGVYTATFTASAVGANAVATTVNNAALPVRPAITISGAAYSISRSSLKLVSSTVASGTSTTVTLQAEDAHGNKETGGGLTVLFKLGAGRGRGTFSPVTDNDNGTYTATFTGTTAGANAITATIDGHTLTAPAAPFKVLPGSVSLAKSVVTLTAASVKAGSAVTVALQAEDALGNKETTGGLTVAFELANASGGSGAFGALKYNKNGTYTETFTGNQAGGNAVIATINGQPVASVAPHITIVPGAASAAMSTVGVSATSVQAGGAITVTLQAVDAEGNKETSGGLKVAFELAAGSGAQGAFGPVKDNKNGTYSAIFKGELAGANSIIATITGVKVADASPTITVTPGPVSLARSVVTLSRTIVATGGDVTVTLQAEDAYGNKLTVGGLTIAFALSSLHGGLGNFSSVTDNNNGTYMATFTGMAPGANTIEAEISGQKLTSLAPRITIV
jgi:RHS repeat-associated protein